MNTFLLASSVLVTASTAAMADSTTRLGCDADINGDVVVDVSDVLDIVSSWNTPSHDTNGDGNCGVYEILQVLDEFGRTCHPFVNDVQVVMDYDAGVAIVTGAGLADHVMGPFDGTGICDNPNTPTNQNFEWRIPLQPVRTSNPAIDLLNTLGAVGVSVNGVSVYNPYDGGGVDAPSTICMDNFNGHPSPDGSYHYHQASDWVYESDASGHSILMGYQFDGFPIYGPYETDGLFAKDLSGDAALDACNGHEDPIRGYHYHAISYELDAGGFPWIAGCFAGVPEESNFQGGGGPPPPGGCTGCASVMAPPPVCFCLEGQPDYASCCTVWTDGTNGPDCCEGAAACGWACP